MIFSREPLGASAYSGATSAWGNLTPDSEALRMLIAVMWHPVENVLRRATAPEDTEPFAEMNRIISSLQETADGVR